MKSSWKVSFARCYSPASETTGQAFLCYHLKSSVHVSSTPYRRIQAIRSLDLQISRSLSRPEQGASALAMDAIERSADRSSSGSLGVVAPCILVAGDCSLSSREGCAEMNVQSSTWDCH